MEQGEGLGTRILRVVRRQQAPTQVVSSPPASEATTEGESIDQYLAKRPRGGQTHENPGLPQGEVLTIPLGKFGNINFTKENGDWRTNRDSHEYNYKLFWDEFEADPQTVPGEPLRTRELVEKPRLTAGGTKAAFAPGKRVLDLGSGEAIALLEYARQFPETVFIGVDIGYDRQVQPNLTQPGVQLTKDDWSVLATIPDGSIDTILSIQGATRWGINGEKNLVNTVDRIAKPGAVFRFDQTFSGNGERLNLDTKLLTEKGWEIPQPGIAVKGLS